MLRLTLVLPGSEGPALWEALGRPRVVGHRQQVLLQGAHAPPCSARPGRSFAGAVTPQEEEEFRRLAALPNVYEVISKSIAPSIFGGTDMKKAIACLLFGGSRKRWVSRPPRSGEGNE